MFDSRVFECGVCFKRYNLSIFQLFSNQIGKNRPLSLPCGHVFCEECLLKCAFDGDKLEKNEGPMSKYIICPSDNKRHYGINLSSLPVCYTILSNLPKETQNPNTSSMVNTGSLIKHELCCIRHQKKKIKFFCETHCEFLCTTCIVQHTGPGHTVTNFSITSIFFFALKFIGEQAKQNLYDVLQKYETQISENTKQKVIYDQTDKRLFEYFTCQLNKLNMAYDSAIKIINEKRKQFTEILKQSLTEEKRRIDAEKSKTYKKIEKFTEGCKALKESSQKIDTIPYEDLYKLMLQKNAEFKQLGETNNIKPPPEVVYACFKDSIKLSDLGSIQYLKSNEVKDFPTSKPKPNINNANSPQKDFLDRREKCNSIQKGNRASDLDTSKTQRKEKKSRIDKTCVDAIMDHNEPIKNNASNKEEGNPQPKINESLYPQTSRGKNNYFAISAYHPPARSKATPSKHKNPKLTNNSSHTSTKAPDTLTPKPAKEASETMIKYGTSNLAGISRLVKKELEKENVAVLKEEQPAKIMTVREMASEKILSTGLANIPAGTGRGSTANPSSTLITGIINPVIEDPQNENDKSIAKQAECENEQIRPKEFNIFEANVMNADYVNALNNTSVVAHKIENATNNINAKTNQRSTSTSHRQTHMAKYTGAVVNNKSSSKGILQPKQVQQQVIKIQARDKALSSHPPQVPKKKHVFFINFAYLIQ